MHEAKFLVERADDDRVELRAGAALELGHRLALGERLAYTRSEVIASQASATKMMRAPSGISSPRSRSG